MCKKMLKLIIEAIVVGIVVTIIGFPSSLIALKIWPIGGGRDHRPVMYLSLFITGILAHLGFEALRINKWYCVHGNACAT